MKIRSKVKRKISGTPWFQDRERFDYHIWLQIWYDIKNDAVDSKVWRHTYEHVDFQVWNEIARLVIAELQK